MRIKPYPKYKESGIKWIGKIPEEWEVHRIKSFIPFVKNGQWGNEPSSNANDFIVLRVADFSEFNFNLNKELTIRNIKDTNLKLKEGDLVIEKSGGGEKQLVGRVVQLKNSSKEKKYTYSNFIGKLEIGDRMNKLFLNYYFKAFYNNRLNFKYIKQTTGIQNIDSSSLIQRECFAYPINKKYQKSIVSFLDKKISGLDNLIEKDKRLIELLKEKRIALINRAVTKGLDPNAKMKDSGIDWIGEIPENWEVYKLKYQTIINKKKLEDNKNPNYVMNYLDISNVDCNGNILDIEEQIFENAPSRARRIPKFGDTILSTVRTYLKAIAYLENIPDNLVVSTGFAVLEPLKSINSKYLFYSINSEVFVQNVIVYSKGVAYPAINPPELGQIPIIVPPISEQAIVVKFLNKATTKINKTIDKIEEKIKLLEEYKKSLIHHVVTGKIDVREAI